MSPDDDPAVNDGRRAVLQLGAGVWPFQRYPSSLSDVTFPHNVFTGI